MSGDLWGGRFGAPMDAHLRRFSSSLGVDRRLALADVRCTRAHARGLLDAGVLDRAAFERLTLALDTIEAEVRSGRFPPEGDEPQLAEDVHSAVERRLIELCGEDGQRIHAGRSRNDQVATDALIWLREASREVEEAVRQLQAALLDCAERQGKLLVFAYTHLQRAQPVLLAHHLLAHVEALERDVDRLRDARRRADRCPLGAGACAGSSLPLDREAAARRLGFSRVWTHAMDAVSDRDWAVEFVGVCALTMTHLSRLAEELVLWSSQEFARLRFGDEWSTGSSMMPQKRNPDVAELVRGRTARVHGALLALHTLLKGLPLAYNRDLQEDKAFLFDAAETTRECARALAAALSGATFFEPRAAGPDFSVATDLAEELVRRGVPFREAHARIGRLVAACEADGRGLAEATDGELEAVGLGGLDRALLTPRGSIAAKRTLGSTHPSEVQRMLREARERLRQ